MSIKITSYVWENFKGTHGELLILLALSDYSNDAGFSWPYTKSLSKKSHCSQSTLFSALSKFEEDGWIRRVSRKGESNLYQVLTPDTEGIQFSEMYPELDTTPPSNRIPSIKNHKEPLTDKTAKPKKERPRNIIYDAISDVTQSPPDSFKGKIVADLIKINPDKDKDWIVDQIYSRFGDNGLWYKNDFRGQQGKPPSPSQVYQEWIRVLGVVSNSKKSHATNSDLRAAGYPV